MQVMCLLNNIICLINIQSKRVTANKSRVLIITVMMHDHTACKSSRVSLIVYKVLSEANPLHWIHGTAPCQRHSLCISLKTEAGSIKDGGLHHWWSTPPSFTERGGGGEVKEAEQDNYFAMSWNIRFWILMDERTDDQVQSVFKTTPSLVEMIQRGPAPQKCHCRTHTQTNAPPPVVLSICSRFDDFAVCWIPYREFWQPQRVVWEVGGLGLGDLWPGSINMCY